MSDNDLCNVVFFFFPFRIITGYKSVHGTCKYSGKTRFRVSGHKRVIIIIAVVVHDLKKLLSFVLVIMTLFRKITFFAVFIITVWIVYYGKGNET